MNLRTLALMVAATLALACGSPPPAATALPTASAPPPPPPQVDASVADTSQGDAGAPVADRPPLTLPFHDGTILRVLGVPRLDDDDHPYADIEPDAKITLERFDPRTKAVQPLGRIGVVTGGNYGGLFVPVGITRDDAFIVLRAHMGSPGAGGSVVDLGYGVIPTRGSGDRKVDTIATAKALFLDGFDVVVFVDEGDDTPHWTQPGPSNDAVVKMRVVGHGRAKVLLAEHDTSYTLLSVDPRARTVTYEAKHYVFSAACPRQQDDALDCAQSTVRRGVLHVP